MALVDWIDVLSTLPQEAIDAACREWLREHTHRPAPAAIRDLALRWYAQRNPALRLSLVPTEAPDKVAVPMDRREQIMAEIGFNPAGFGLKHMPKGPTE